MHWYGVEGEYFILILDLLGPSIEDLFVYCGNHFSLKTVLMIADQMLQRIETFHSCDMIHSDIKPENFLFGRHSRNTHNIVHIIDFGLSRKYRDHVTHEHIPCRENRPLVGTARYVSLNTHLGIEQSRRDDLESIGFVLLYLLLGKLPWQGLKLSNTKLDKNYKIKAKKLGLTIELLCKNLPDSFCQYLKECRVLSFDAKPNYTMFRKLFRETFVSYNFEADEIYDWTQSFYSENIVIPKSVSLQKSANISNVFIC